MSTQHTPTESDRWHHVLCDNPTACPTHPEPNEPHTHRAECDNPTACPTHNPDLQPPDLVGWSNSTDTDPVIDQHPDLDTDRPIYHSLTGIAWHEGQLMARCATCTSPARLTVEVAPSSAHQGNVWSACEHPRCGASQLVGLSWRALELGAQFWLQHIYDSRGHLTHPRHQGLTIYPVLVFVEDGPHILVSVDEGHEGPVAGFVLDEGQLIPSDGQAVRLAPGMYGWPAPPTGQCCYCQTPGGWYRGGRRDRHP